MIFLYLIMLFAGNKMLKLFLVQGSSAAIIVSVSECSPLWPSHYFICLHLALVTIWVWNPCSISDTANF